jgi:hypothetical protein
VSFRCTPLELLRLEELPRLDPLPAGPFDDAGAGLIESWFIAALHDPVHTRLGLLFGTPVNHDAAADAPNARLLVLDGVSEFGWKAEAWDLPRPPQRWILIEAGFVGLNASPRVQVRHLPGWQPMYSGPPAYRFRLGLHPNAETVIAFNYARYYLGSQSAARVDRPESAAILPDRETNWLAMTDWPRRG